MIKKGLKLLGDTFEVVTLKKVIVCYLLGLFCQLRFFVFWFRSKANVMKELQAGHNPVPPPQSP